MQADVRGLMRGELGSWLSQQTEMRGEARKKAFDRWFYGGIAILPVFALLTLARTGLTSEVSRTVSDTVQGRMQGTLASIAALASILAFALMSQAFAWGGAFAGPDHWLAGLPFLIAAILTFGALLCIFPNLRLFSLAGFDQAKRLGDRGPAPTIMVKRNG